MADNELPPRPRQHFPAAAAPPAANTNDPASPEKAALDFAVRYKGRVESLDARGFAAALRKFDKISAAAAKHNSTAAQKNLRFFTAEIRRLPEADMLEKISAAAGLPAEGERPLAAYLPWLARVRALKGHDPDSAVAEYRLDKHETTTAAWRRLYMQERAALEAGAPADKKTFALIANTLMELKSVDDVLCNFKKAEDAYQVQSDADAAALENFLQAVRRHAPQISARLAAHKGNTADVAESLSTAEDRGRDRHDQLSAPLGHLLAAPPSLLAETVAAYAGLQAFQQTVAGEADSAAQRGLLATQTAVLLEAVAGQAAIVLFERAAHAEYREKGELPPERLDALWKQARRECFGAGADGATGADWITAESFFHAPFQAADVALGHALALILQTQRGGDSHDFDRRFEALQAAGGTQRTGTALREFGIDLSAASCWDRAFSALAGRIDPPPAAAKPPRPPGGTP